MESSSQNCWIKYDPKTEQFPIQNIPFGVCTESNQTFCCTRIADQVINLHKMESAGLFSDISIPNGIFNSNTLNPFIALGRPVWKNLRNKLQTLFTDSTKSESLSTYLTKVSNIKMQLPVFTQDYTDFYSSKNHAFNMGKIIRGEKDALQANWVHIPVGYHGRASTIVVDGTPIKRPRGQTKPPKDTTPSFVASKRLDYEVEVGVIVGKSNEMGSSVKVKDAEDYVFGLVLLNDWSARDVQTWEYVPLGPFNAKNFATTISPWIVTLEALEAFKVELPKQDPTPLKYLQDTGLYSWDIPIDVNLKGKNQSDGSMISQTNYKYMYWTVRQQIAHHTVTGCKLNVGDIFGSGTISGTDEFSYGSMFELSQAGSKTISIGNETRTWLDDGDYVNFTAVIKGNGYNIGFGNCGGEVLPANPEEDYY